MKRYLVAALIGLFGAAAQAAENDVTLVISGQAEAPVWVKLPDGSYQVTISTGKLAINKAGLASTGDAAGAKASEAGQKVAAAAAPEAGAIAEDAMVPVPSPFADAAKKAVVDQVKKEFNGKGKEAVENYKNYLVDMSIPTTPAFAVLGATPETILQPKSPRDLAVSLVQDLSDKSKVGKGVGFDVAPYMLAYGSTTTLGQYRDRPEVQFLSNAQLSFGAIKQDVTAGSVTRLSGGASFIFFDKGDPRLSNGLNRCFQDAAKKELTIGDSDTDALVQEVLNAQRDAPAGAKPEATPLMVAATKRLSTAYNDCREKFKAVTWNSTRWTAGLAQAVHNRGGGTQKGAAGIWTTYSLNLNGDDGSADLSALKSEARSQALFHYRHTNREEVASTTDARGFELRRGDLLAIGFKYGSDKRNVSAEASVQRARFDTGGLETSRKLAIGGELMISKDLWLVMSIGGQGGQKNGNNSPFALAGLKFGSASESTGAFGK